MATTDARPGFRLPWGSDRSENGDQADASHGETTAGDATPTDHESETAQMIDAASASPESEVAADPAGADGTGLRQHAGPRAAHPQAEQVHGRLDEGHAERGRQRPRRKPLSASLPRRAQRVEAIRADTANEAVELRKQADEDIAAVRDWSKGEIARIREETDHRISERKASLERELEDHAGSIETRDRARPGPGRRLRGRDGRLLRAPDGRRGPDPLRGDGREPARAATARYRSSVRLASPAPAPAPRRGPGGRRGADGRRRGTREVAEAQAEAAPEVELIGDTPTATDAVATDQPAGAEATNQVDDETAASTEDRRRPVIEAPADDGGDLFSIAEDAPTRPRA